MTSNIVDQNDEIISVGELNRSAKYLLEKNFNNVSVIGEISNLSRQIEWIEGKSCETCSTTPQVIQLRLLQFSMNLE